MRSASTVAVAKTQSRACLQNLFAGRDFWWFRTTSDDPLYTGNLPARSPGPPCSLTHFAASLSNDFPSSTPYLARNSTSSAPGLTRGSSRLTSCSTPGPSCLPLRPCHSLLLNRDASRIGRDWQTKLTKRPTLRNSGRRYLLRRKDTTVKKNRLVIGGKRAVSSVSAQVPINEVAGKVGTGTNLPINRPIRTLPRLAPYLPMTLKL
jgi:hypothetical protein